jgi:hypothetical protein
MKGQENIGCGKLFLYGCAGLLILFVVNGACTGIGQVFDDMPWYLYLIVTIGFIFLITRFVD